MIDPPVRALVSGQARSGTTLVTKVLDAQDGCTIHNEFFSAPLMLARRFGGYRRHLSGRERNIALSLVKMHLRRGGYSLEVGPADFSNVAQLYRLGLERLATKGDRVVGHKVLPAHDFLPRLLEETDVRCIFVLRDVRDVVLSQWNWGSEVLETPLDTTIEQWKRSVRHAEAFGSHPRLLILRFEELIAAPAAALAPVERHLGIEMDLDRRRLESQAGLWLENSSFHDVRQIFDTRPVGRWKEHRSAEPVRYAAWACAAELRRLGYEEVEATTLSRSDRWRFSRRWLALGALRLAKPARQAILRRLLPPFSP